eukprot:316892-Chlamydomonas_euryale.AAC.2
MVSLYNNHLNGILADEMGLGKTVQVWTEGVWGREGGEGVPAAVEAEMEEERNTEGGSRDGGGGE